MLLFVLYFLTERLIIEADILADLFVSMAFLMCVQLRFFLFSYKNNKPFAVHHVLMGFSLEHVRSSQIQSITNVTMLHKIASITSITGHHRHPCPFTVETKIFCEKYRISYSSHFVDITYILSAFKKRRAGRVIREDGTEEEKATKRNVTKA